MRRVVITGTGGFIGRHLAARLSADGHEVIGLVRPARASFEAAATHVFSSETTPHGPFREVGVDLLDPAAMRPWLRRADWCVHLAGVIEARRAEDFHRSNVLVTRRLLQACREAAPGPARFLYCSSIAAQGPCYEGRPLRESDPCRPETEYGRSKEEAERVCREFCGDLRIVILRPAFIYGRGDRRGLAMIQSLFGPAAGAVFGRTRTISLCHVADLVAACSAALLSDCDAGEVFLVSDGEAHTPAGLRETLRPLFGGSISMDPAASTVSERMQDWACDISRARERLGFVPRVGLVEGARDTIDWYREIGALSDRIPAVREER